MNRNKIHNDMESIAFLYSQMQKQYTLFIDTYEWT